MKSLYAKRFRIFPSNVILWGGTGQSKVVRPIVEHYGAKVVAIFDDNHNLPAPFSDIPLYYGKKGFQEWIQSKNRTNLSFCVTIGNPYGHARIRIHEWLMQEGLKPTIIVHPSAEIAENAIIGEGCQFMAGAVVNPQARLGRECIINTNASVDHECVLEDGVELAPATTLCGHVKIGVNSWICAGATILPRVKIGKDVIVGAGSVVLANVPNNVTVVGVPATRVLKKRGNTSNQK